VNCTVKTVVCPGIVSMNLLYLSNSRFVAQPYLDASTRYRGYHFAEELVRLGHRADVIHIDLLKMAMLEHYDTVILIRPSYSKRLDRVLRRCRRLGIRCIADFDDLIFDPNYAAESPQALNNQASISRIQRKQTSHLKALEKCEFVTVSTTALGEHVSVLTGNTGAILTLPNGLSNVWLSHNEGLIPGSDAKNCFSYLSGSSSHNHDFTQIEAPVSDYLKQHRRHRFSVVGSLELNTDHFSSDQLETLAPVRFESLPRLILSANVTLAPLADTPFNRCKSHIKFIEAAAFGIPTISSRIPDIDRHSIGGLGIADSASDWHDWLYHFMKNPVRHSDLSTTLKDYVHTHCTSESGAKALVEFLNGRISEPNEHSDPAARVA